MILTEQAVAAGPLLSEVAARQHKASSTLAVALARDPANVRKSIRAYEAAGWLVRAAEGEPMALTEEGRAVVEALARANGAGGVAAAQGFAREIPLDLIDEEPGFNPRKRHDEASHAELTASVRERGVLQPIKVRPAAEEGRYFVVMGSRRRRAAIAAGLTTIRAIVEDVGSAQAFEEAVIENVQRQDMTEMEEARAFDQIIKTRMAADPELKLKDAKAAVAAIVRRTPEYVMQRTHLLQLPEAKQEALQEGEITFTEARKWLQSRPKLLTLTPLQWLIALEVYDAQERAAAADPEERGYAFAACRQEAEEDPDAEALQVADMLTQPRETYGGRRGLPTGHFRVRLHDHRLDQLRLKFACDVAEEDFRDGALLAIRSEVRAWEAGLTVEEMRQAWPPGLYVTRWLNGPFGPSEARAAELASELADLDRQDEERQAAAARAETERKTAEAAGRDRLASVEEIAQSYRDEPATGRFDREITALLADGGKPLPWFPTPRAGILAANGEAVLHDYPAHNDPAPDTLARVTLMAVAVNAAAGFGTPQEPPEQAEAPIEDELDVGETDDGGVIDTEDEDEPETEDASADDAPLAPWERRLIGAGGTPAHP